MGLWQSNTEEIQKHKSVKTFYKCLQMPRECHKIKHGANRSNHVVQNQPVQQNRQVPSIQQLQCPGTDQTLLASHCNHKKQLHFCNYNNDNNTDSIYAAIRFTICVCLFECTAVWQPKTTQS